MMSDIPELLPKHCRYIFFYYPNLSIQIKLILAKTTNCKEIVHIAFAQLFTFRIDTHIFSRASKIDI